MKVRVVVALLMTLGAGSVARAEGETAGFAPVAEPAAGFGGMGQLVLSMGPTTDEHLFFHKDGGGWQLQLAPAADYFLAAHISVGAIVRYGHTSGGGNTPGSDTFGLTARAGYAFGINERFGVWPLGGLSVGHSSAGHTSSTSTSVILYAPFMFHPAPHFFVGLGPSFRLKLSGDGNQFGIDSMLGGWF
jgi:opacity protein-like surface antigen